MIALGAAVLALIGYIALRPAAKTPEVAPPAVAPTAAETKAAPATPAPQKISNKSIAVLPLANMSEDKDTGFFADGVHEDLLTNLALVSELKVVSRTTVTQYRGTTKSMKQIGEELGVAYILEGSVRRSGNKVRVTGQLINARTDEHVWAKSYDRDLTDIFTIQATLAQEIASALQAAITPQAQKFIERRPTENPIAYDDYLKGRDIRNRAPTASPAALTASEKQFQNAVTLDPNFAAAWGELAAVHALNVFWEQDASEERKAKGDAAIAHAVSLAPDAPEVIRAVGTYAYYAHRDYPRATAAYEKILRLQPNDPTAYGSLGLILRRQGRWADSLANLRRAVELDPANISYNRNLLSTLIHARRFEEAFAQQRRIIALLPGQLREELALADGMLSVTGSFKAADALLARLTPEQRESPVALYYRKSWAETRDDYAEFKRLDQQQPTYAEAELPLFSLYIAAMNYFSHGEVELARTHIAKAFDEALALVKSQPSNLRARIFLGGMEAIRGHPEAAVRLGREVVELLPETRDAVDGPSCRYTAAQIYAMIGDKEQALAELTHLLQIPSQFTTANIRVDPVFKPLRSDRRFEALLNDPKNNAPLF
jgi:TolB-like protein/cytochrome c-type biogenesis protein CcmH/NrfG